MWGIEGIKPAEFQTLLEHKPKDGCRFSFFQIWIVDFTVNRLLLTKTSAHCLSSAFQPKNAAKKTKASNKSRQLIRGTMLGKQRNPNHWTAFTPSSNDF